MTDESMRELSLERWGKALLEELLFRAAQSVAEGASGDGFIEVPLRFRLTPSVAEDCIEIRTERAAEGPLVTRLSRPF